MGSLCGSRVLSSQVHSCRTPLHLSRCTGRRYSSWSLCRGHNRRSRHRRTQLCKCSEYLRIQRHFGRQNCRNVSGWNKLYPPSPGRTCKNRCCCRCRCSAHECRRKDPRRTGYSLGLPHRIPRNLVPSSRCRRYSSCLFLGQSGCIALVMSTSSDPSIQWFCQ